MSQIAGRAGRFKNDGKFGTTGECETLNSDEIEKLRNIYFLLQNDILEKFKIKLLKPKLISSLELKPGQKNLLRTNDSWKCFRFFSKR